VSRGTAVANRCEWIADDYRTIPKHTKNKKYDKITCLEMAEHVGINNFTNFLLQVLSMLKDDGMFYLQMCGVRRCWCFEDIVWIMFMGKYVFPGADASTPINWVLNQLERNGFEVHRVENCGVHYARTIAMWASNWKSNEKKVVDKYGAWWYRVWEIFLAWSSIIARQGTSAPYMITCTKNLVNDQFSVNTRSKDQPCFNRTKAFIGDKLIAFQQ
jgi:cyclopropane fatty-acyl-phospholipid synthase-like methyltransferase